jgi:hypothetical protein
MGGRGDSGRSPGAGRSLGEHADTANTTTTPTAAGSLRRTRSRPPVFIAFLLDPAGGLGPASG